MIRQCTLRLRLLRLSALALLSGCVRPPPPPAPQPPPAPPAPVVQDIHKAEQHAYWAGYAAGRRYQRKLDAQVPDAPPPVASVVPPAPTPVPQPVPPPPNGYSISGPAQPIATPLN